METELQLLNAIRSGEEEAKRRLYERFVGIATATAQRYIPQCDRVRDVLQDSFVKILTSIDSFNYRGEGSLKAWVTTIVTHRALNFIREHDRELPTDHLPDKASDEEPDLGRVPSDVMNRLIGQLPAGYRLILNLHVFERLPHKEIARLLGIRPDTSASQFTRAKNRLAELINDYLKTEKQ